MKGTFKIASAIVALVALHVCVQAVCALAGLSNAIGRDVAGVAVTLAVVIGGFWACRKLGNSEQVSGPELTDFGACHFETDPAGVVVLPATNKCWVCGSRWVYPGPAYCNCGEYLGGDILLGQMLFLAAAGRRYRIG